MSEQNPYQQLGVTEDASFEEIQEAKQRLLQQHSGDSKVLESIEMAYDSIIMERLRLRQEGKIKVPERIRFPEREKPSEPPLSLNSLPINTSPSWLQRFIDTPSSTDILVAAGVFLALTGVTIVVEDTQGSLVPLLLTLGIFANVYFLNRKEQQFWRSVLITLVALVIGIAIGAGVAGLGLNLINLDSQQLYAIMTFCLFWLSSSFLR
ncbi:heat shock protein DnaJ domain protein [Gloeothece citriformis PCC 7424]|uniref:Heat shock protein DnaJ domain protein n=1 Tax=Gloeothece citriformis (strain PCC 7424) TaxID=65393 RepID=B7K9K5_GLOC7|nr:CPP1-like family protein [Gloeothece citriformis]ACK69973.1 heat shock protein DnaJ domain protein [Gloeothece citriformis PCC 7424]